MIFERQTPACSCKVALKRLVRIDMTCVLLCDDCETLVAVDVVLAGFHSLSDVPHHDDVVFALMTDANTRRKRGE